MLAAWDRDLTGKFTNIDRIPRQLARGDVALASGRAPEALAAYRAAQKSVCGTCILPRIARAFEARQQPDSAIRAYEAYLSATDPAQFGTDARELARTYKRLGELYETQGDTKRAIQRYSDFVALWKDADPELQPEVTRIRDKIAALEKLVG